jgi:hypothetical protein
MVAVAYLEKTDQSEMIAMKVAFNINNSMSNVHFIRLYC